jgi:hypothetical protein
MTRLFSLLAGSSLALVSVATPVSAQQTTQRPPALAVIPFATAAAAAQAQDGACLTRKISPILHIDQSNGARVTARIQQSEAHIGGVAEYSQHKDGKVQIIAGPIDGQTNGNVVRFVVYWNNNTSGLYAGSINANDTLQGNAVERTNPQNKATFTAHQASYGCLVQAPPPPIPETPASPPVDAGPSTASAATLLRWFNRGDLGRTKWAFEDANTVAWAQAARAAAELCGIHGIGAGHFSGHQDLGKGTFGVQCSDANVVWREASAQEISSSGWGFSDVNQVSWAQANRAAERLCAGANQGFAGGHFNGHQGGGNYGLFCYRGSSQWFDASDAELAATGFGFATPKLDDVQWAQAMRAATGFCQAKGFEGGFMNGHQAPNRYGVVCQKGLGN